jgi:hypothetical protein
MQIGELVRERASERSTIARRELGFTRDVTQHDEWLGELAARFVQEQRLRDRQTGAMERAENRVLLGCREIVGGLAGCTDAPHDDGVMCAGRVAPLDSVRFGCNPATKYVNALEPRSRIESTDDARVSGIIRDVHATPTG